MSTEKPELIVKQPQTDSEMEKTRRGHWVVAVDEQESEGDCKYPFCAWKPEK